jgi:hypoxanthine phosphoribosyltransferase
MFEVLIQSSVLQARIQELAHALVSTSSGAETPYFVSVLEGASKFENALCDKHPELARADRDSVKLSSYGGGTESSGKVQLIKDLAGEVAGRRVVVLEDIVDTGRTVHFLSGLLRERGAASVEVYTLLSKPSRRVVDVPLAGVGFEIPDQFVIGFGMDLDGRYRELPYVGIYEAEAAQLADRALEA